MNKIITKYTLFFSFLALFFAEVALPSCNKMDQREDAEETQIANFKKSIAKDTLNVYEIDGIILDIQKMGTEEYKPDDTLTLIFTGVAMQRNITFAKNDTARVIYGDNNLIDGWKIALPFIKKNSSGLLLVTYDKGFGKERVGVVEPYSTLKFTFTAK